LAIVLILGLYLAFAAAAALALVDRLETMVRITQAVPRIALLAICSFAYLVGPRVYGLEYEDAFVHEAASLWRSSHWLDVPDGFYATVCAAGSAQECVVSGSFGTQLIGLSILLAVFRSVGVEASHAVNIVSAIAGALSLQVVWSILTAYVSSSLSRSIAIALIASATSFYMISGSGFAEPLFVFFLLTHLSSYLALCESPPHQPTRAAQWVLLMASGALMIVCKKEGTLLVVLLPLYDVACACLKGKGQSALCPRRLALGLVSLALLLFAIFAVRILDAADRHSADIGHPAFSLGYVTGLVPPFGRAALTIGYFGLLGWLTLLALPIALYSRDRNAGRLLVVLGGFSLLYVLHARHNAFVLGASVEPEEMVRYLYVEVPIAAIFVALNLQYVLHRCGLGLPRRLETIAPCGIALLAALGFASVIPSLYRQREDTASDEYANRTKLLDADSSRSGRVVYVSPYSTALIASLGKTGLVVDSAVVTDDAVKSWLRARVGEGVSLVIDRELCKLPIAPASLAGCEFLAELQTRPK